MALANATWSGKTIVTVVSRFTGLANDTQSRSAVLDYINLGLWELSLQTPWDWNALQAADQAIVAGTSDYNLPTGAGVVYDEVYDVRMVGANERTLDKIDLSHWDKVARGDQDAQNIPTHYTIFGAQQNGTIRLLPTPSVNDTLRFRYISRQAIIADSTGSSLAIPDKYIPLVIFKGAENVAAWKTPERVAYWNGKFMASLSRAFESNRVGMADEPAFSPRMEHDAVRVLDGINVTDLDVYPRG